MTHAGMDGESSGHKRFERALGCRRATGAFVCSERDEQYVNRFLRPRRVLIVLGVVDDLDELYRSVRVIACPIRWGGGTRVKIIERPPIDRRSSPRSWGPRD